MIIALVLLASAVALYQPRRTASTLLLLLGAGCFVIVTLTHVSESLQIYPMFGWGEPGSVGHYVDLVAAVLGAALGGLRLLLQYIRALQSGAHVARGSTPSNNRWSGP